MEWSKLKNVILLILLCTNAALLIMVLGQNYKQESAGRQAQADAIAFLQQEGTEVEDAVVPQKNDLSPLKAERDRDEEEKLAQTLLGEGLTAQDRGGGVYLYRSALGEIQFHSDGAFQAYFQTGAFPLNGDAPEEHARGVMSRLNFDGQVLSVQAQADGCTVQLCQQWQGAPVFNLQVALNYSGGELASITGGRRLFGAPQEQEGRVMTPASALMHFSAGLNALGDVCSRIDSIQPGYVSSASLTDGMILTPVWHITTDTGGYQLDLVTGGLSRS